ncbi:MAG: YebC/PmpR family DNA-binding transcriptional regulator [Bacillati bacterium ANGP1]|uniref:Probable transcriptional regulatory protein E6G98_12880 n=1 Tax=Candidatus Segetimicrobium genomatis TaxID=2569760 RepID=A0A537LJ55_9BACT|nr:MAG: YebC/PmpR family DNA-binding transcriptional regulator [Terrabacteria group bacterium ANGP1]
MSGHSKWHNIRLKKEKVDQVRGKLFSKLAREIAVAAKEGGGDPDGNPRLRTAIDHAREAGMPNDNIQRAIQRGAGGAEGATFETITYEGYAPGGVAVLVEVLTDNRNRAASDVRTSSAPASSADDVLSPALEAGAEDVRTSGDVYEIVTPPDRFFKVKQAVERARLPIVSADIMMVPKTTVRVEGKEAQHVLRLMEALEDHDDVQHAYANFDVPDEILQQVG